MALRPTPLGSAEHVEWYFKNEWRNGQSEYYAKDKGVWYGKLVGRLDLSPEVDRKEFAALLKNKRPDGTRLTQRTNKGCKKMVWELDEVSQSRVRVEKQVANRRVAVDWTLSVPKDISVYLAATHDPVVKKIIHRAAYECLDALQAEMETQVQKGGQQSNRVTGEALFAVFVHRETRPVDGLPDPHYHVHALQINVTYDQVEDRFKAGNIRFSNKSRHEERFHARVWDDMRDAGYGFRRTAKGLEMTVLNPGEKAIFEKRSRQIEAIAHKQGTELRTKATAIVQGAAKRGEFLEHESVLMKLKDALGAQNRNRKDTSKFEGQALEAEWAKQLKEGRWEAITPEIARNGAREGFLEPDVAKTLAIQHAFEKDPVIRDQDLFKAIVHFGAGSMSRDEMETFCATDPRLARNPGRPGMVTTWECVAEEQKIRDLVAAGKSSRDPISVGNAWVPTDKQLDAGQLAALKLILETRDSVIAIPGRPGAGKSRLVAEAASQIKAITGREVFVLAPTGRQAIALAKACGGVPHTIAEFKVNKALQNQAKGRTILCDEFSMIGNADATQLLEFASNNCSTQLVFFGDRKQLQSVSRGNPINDLIEARLIDYAELQKIYRQTNPELLAAVTAAAEGRFQESVDMVKANDWFHTEETEDKLRAALVADLVERIKRDEPVMAIALMHRHGEAVTREARALLKDAGLVGKEDTEVRWLKPVERSEAQRADPVSYSAGDVLKFHQRAAGFGSGEAWTVVASNEATVLIERNGIRKLAPLQSPGSFKVYEAGTMALAAGDPILATRPDPKANVKTGDLCKVKEIRGDSVTLTNGKTVDAREGIYFRGGYTLTGHAAQGDQKMAVLPYLPASVSHMVDQRSWVVMLSRAVESLRVYTDCLPLIEQRAVTANNKESALAFMGTVAEQVTRETAIEREQAKIRKQVLQQRPHLTGAALEYYVALRLPKHLKEEERFKEVCAEYAAKQAERENIVSRGDDDDGGRSHQQDYKHDPGHEMEIGYDL